MKAILFIFFIVLGGILFAANFYPAVFERLREGRDIAVDLAVEEIEKVAKEVSAPSPLRQAQGELLQSSSKAVLTRAGVVQWTNIQRAQNGLPPLTENALLNAAAATKAQDMFARQFFAHVSPSGEGAGDLATFAGYEFIAIGENLALGNYEDDKTLVQAWMDSPGHRANILNTRYREIGVAVVKGIFEGSSTWLGVQIFGLPLSACPQPAEELAEQIEKYEIQIDELENDLLALKSEIERTRPKRGQAYNQMVEEYNGLVGQYNALVKELKTIVAQYNAQVQAFNECVSSG